MSADEPPKDPRARRWTILLVLLALVVAAGVGLRVADDRRSSGGDDRARDRTAQDESAGGGEGESGDAGDSDSDSADGDDPSDDDQSPDPDSVAATDDVGDGSPDPLGIVLTTTTDIDGDPATYVEQLGPLLANATLPAATRAFGEPDASGPDAGDPDVCAATWVAFEFEARFYYGHPPSSEASCARGPLAAALMTGEQWFIRSLAGAADAPVLDVGDPVADITSSFPLAERVALSPGLQQLSGSDDGWLLAEGSYGGDPFPTLYAIDADGSISAFLYVSGAD